MAAIVEISETNGNANGGTGSPYTTPTVTDGIANINFGSYDIPNIVTTKNWIPGQTLHPIILSAIGRTYSVTKWLRFHLVNLGSSTSVGNIKIWKYSGALLGPEILGRNSGMGYFGGYSGDALIHYGTSPNGTDFPPTNTSVAVPYSGSGTVPSPGPSGGGAWWSVGIATSVPGTENWWADDGKLLRVMSAAEGNAPGYSSYLTMALALNGAGGSVPGPVNTKVMAVQYDES